MLAGAWVIAEPDAIGAVLNRHEGRGGPYDVLLRNVSPEVAREGAIDSGVDLALRREHLKMNQMAFWGARGIVEWIGRVRGPDDEVAVAGAPGVREA